MVALTASCTIVVNDDGDRNYPYANQNGDRWDDNWNWFDCGFYSNGRVAVSRKWLRILLWRLMRCRGGLVFNGKASEPSAQHPAYGIQFFRENDVFFIVERFYFPEELKEKFCNIERRRGAA